MGAYIGIDLGTTFCAISTLDDNGRPVIVNIPDKKIAPEGTLPKREGCYRRPSKESISITSQGFWKI